jgi:bacterial leucyl aminopeptidase
MGSGKYLDYPSLQISQIPLLTSDHLLWHRAGFPATFATEADPEKGGDDPYIHTHLDRINHPDGSLDFEHA